MNMKDDLIGSLNWRYATKGFDKNKPVSNDEFEIISEALRLSASSWGLQPWKFVIVRNQALKEKLRAAAWNQAQITDSSHLIVLCTVDDMTPEFIDNYMKEIAKTRDVPIESLNGLKDAISGSMKAKSPEDRKEWMARQVYIALGTLLTACAIRKVDACPMEGFSKPDFDRILGLEKLGLHSQVACAVGYRSESDPAAKQKKVRFSKKDIIIEM